MRDKVSRKAESQESNKTAAGAKAPAVFLYDRERTAVEVNYVVKMTRRRRRILLAGFYFAQLAEMNFALQELLARRAVARKLFLFLHANRLHLKYFGFIIGLPNKGCREKTKDGKQQLLWRRKDQQNFTAPCAARHAGAAYTGAL